MQMNENATAAMSFFRVPLVCEAAPHVGCGPIAAPVLKEVEQQPGVREAWLNRKGTILGIVWASGTADPDKVIRALGRHALAGIELESDERQLAYEAFARGDGWYRPMQLQELSAEEAQVIAARLVRRLEQNIPLSAATAERLMGGLEQACARTLAAASTASVGIEILRGQVASALLDASREVLDPAAFGAFQAVVALGHRPLPGEK
jgi:hypothetical protein